MWRAPWADYYPNQHPSAECFWWPIAHVWGSPNVQWCEENLCSFISQPANTWSNLAYLLFSGLMWFQAISSSSSATKRSASTKGAAATDGTISKAMLAIYPWTNFICGVGSLVYHLSNVYPTQVLDFIGMFAINGWLLVANLTRLRTVAGTTSGAWRFICCTMAACAFFTHMLYLNGIKIQSLILAAIVAIIVMEFFWCRPLEKKIYAKKMDGEAGGGGGNKSRPGHGWFFLSIISLFIAGSFSFADHKRLFCDPKDHVVQGHSIWHLLSSFALYCLYQHYRLRTRQ